MANLMLLIFLLASVLSCAKSSSLSEDNNVKFNLFSSSYDPCMVPNKCRDQKIIPPMMALNLFEQGRYKTAPQLGDQEIRRIEKTQNTTIFDDGEIKEIACALAFEQKRTLVDIDSSSIYVKEEKSNFQVKPQISDCKNLLKQKENQPLLIAIEDREDLGNGGLIGGDLEEISKLKMETLKINGSPLLRISGVITSVENTEDLNGNPISFTVQTSILIMQDLTQSFFTSNRFNHTIMKINDLIPSESVLLLSEVKKGIDVSGFDIDDYQSNLIIDRRDE